MPAIWQLPPRPIAVLARPALDLVLDLLRTAVPLGPEAMLSVIELLLARSASPLVVLDPLRGADLGLPPRDRDALLGQAVHRRIGDMNETAARLAAPRASGDRADAAALLRLLPSGGGCAMAAGLHGSARTTPRVRAELQRSQEATRAWPPATG